ncbi:GntR family transcriptional regulator [Lentzea flaviverrucosa]|nr:GntR family transcriptional regulator [Lentzea flaviverrucosa]
MRIAINRTMGVPLATQIRDQIVAAIASGQLSRGDRLPTIRQLAEFLGINRNTVAQGYRQLEAEGYVSTRAGGGTTVAETAATADALRAGALRELVATALRTAEAAGFDAREFAELAYYQSAQQPLRPWILVVDEYDGELASLSDAVRAALPDSTVHGMTLADLASLTVSDRAARLRRFDFALVPFYCLEHVNSLLAGADLPTLAAGVGPSLKVLQRIRETSADKRVAIVCSEPEGPSYMERSLRRAEVIPAEVRHAHLGQDSLAAVLLDADLVIASEGSVDTVRGLVDAEKVITYSNILSEESLATIRSYAEFVSRQRAQQ